MLTVNMDTKTGIVVLEPQGALTSDDFDRAAKVIDPYVEREKRLKGLIIHTEEFPGWESFAAFSSHLAFVKEHHKKVARIAVCTDSAVKNFAKLVAPHFISAEVRMFPHKDLAAAKQWVAESAS